MELLTIFLTCVVSGGAGFIVGILLAAPGRFDDADAMSAALADAEAEVTLLRRQNAHLLDELATLSVTLSATRDREEMLSELSREMNQ